MSTTAEYNFAEMAPVGEVIALAANTERKCLLQIQTDPDEVVNAGVLNDRLSDSQEPPDTVRFKEHGIAQLLSDGHVRAGTMQTLSQSDTVAWEVYKEHDSRLPDAAAGHMLGIAARFELSLERLFGISAAPEGSLRSPQAVLRLADFFAAQEVGSAATIHEVAAGAGIPYHTAHGQAERLRKSGFVEYEADSVADEIPRFALDPDVDPTISTLTATGERQIDQRRYAGFLTYRTEIGLVLRNMQQAGITTFTYQDLAARLESPEPLGPQSLRGPVAVMLREGIVSRLHRTTHDKSAFSRIYCTPAQKAIFDRLSAVYQGLAANDPDTIEEGLQLGESILDDPALVTELLQRGYNASIASRRVPYSIRAEVIANALFSGAELSTAQIQGHFEEGTLSVQALGVVLRKMKRQGLITARKEGTFKFWRLLTD